MAFNDSGLAKVSSGSYKGQAHNIWVYATPDDNYATVRASGYFNEATDKLQKSDWIHLSTDDGFWQVIVLTETGSATVQVTNTLPEQWTTVSWSGGGATLVVTDYYAFSGQTLVASITDAPTEAAYLKSAKITANNQVTLELSAANTSNDAKISYITM